MEKKDCLFFNYGHRFINKPTKIPFLDNPADFFLYEKMKNNCCKK